MYLLPPSLSSSFSPIHTVDILVRDILQVLQRQGHGRAVDWWSLGALLYEMITGLPPFYSKNRETMFEKIMKAELSFPPFMSAVRKQTQSSFIIQHPELFSLVCFVGQFARDLLSKLLVRDPKVRYAHMSLETGNLMGQTTRWNQRFLPLIIQIASKY